MTEIRRYCFVVVGGIITLATVTGASRYAVVQTGTAPHTSTVTPPMQPFVGTITGTVHYKNGKPAYNFRVRARSTENWRNEGTAVTDHAGYFEIKNLREWRVRNGKSEYTVTVENEGKPFLPLEPSRKVTLTPTDNRREYVDFVLDAAPEITVRVRDAETDAPVVGYSVNANDSTYSSPSVVGVTDVNGEFVVRAASEEVQIRLDDNQKHPHNPAPGYSDYFQKKLAPGTKTVWEVKTYSNSYNLARTLRGVVVDKKGKPVYGATVRVVRSGNVTPPVVLQTRTNLAGAFAMETTRFDYGAVVLVQEWGNVKDETTAQLIMPRDTWKPLVVRLSPVKDVTVTGTLVDQNDKPAPGVSIWLYSDYVAGASVTPPYRVHSLGRGGRDPVTSDTNGRFIISGIYARTENMFVFEGKGWGRSEYPGLDNEKRGRRVHLNESRDLGRIMVYRADKSVAGRLVDETGEPVAPNVLLVAVGEHTSASTKPEKDGTFTLKPVVDESLSLLIVYSNDRIFGYTPDKMTFPYKRPVKAGATDLRIIAPPRNVAEDKPVP